MRKFLVNLIAEAIEKALLKIEIKSDPLHYGKQIARFELNKQEKDTREKPSEM